MSSIYKKSNTLEVIDKNINELIAAKEGDNIPKSKSKVEDLYTFDKLLSDLFNFAIYRDLEGLSSPDNSVTIGFKINDKNFEVKLNYYTLTIIDKTNNNAMLFSDTVCKADILEGAAANFDLITRAASVLREVI